jgi:hypothetical protein
MDDLEKDEAGERDGGVKMGEMGINTWSAEFETREEEH